MADIINYIRTTSEEDKFHLTTEVDTNFDLHFPAILYKYRDWSNDFHKRLITHNELFLPSPLKFNDPFDCQFTFGFDSLSEQEIFELYCHDLRIHYPEWHNDKILYEAKEWSEKKLTQDKKHLQKISA